MRLQNLLKEIDEINKFLKEESSNPEKEMSVDDLKKSENPFETSK